MTTKIKVTVFSSLILAVMGIIAAAYVGFAGGTTASAAITEYNNFSASNVHRFTDASQVVGVSSTLSRSDNGILAILNTDDLDQGNAYTMWWVVFNNPENCLAPIPGMSNCGEADVFGEPWGQTPVDVSVQYAAGNIVGGTGQAAFGAYLGVGEIPTGNGQMVFGYGLKDAQKAEVHLVIRNHGPVVASQEESQINNFGASCTAETDPTGTGPVGSYECFDQQFAIHLPPSGKQVKPELNQLDSNWATGDRTRPVPGGPNFKQQPRDTRLPAAVTPGIQIRKSKKSRREVDYGNANYRTVSNCKSGTTPAGLGIVF